MIFYEKLFFPFMHKNSFKYFGFWLWNKNVKDVICQLYNCQLYNIQLL